MGADCAFKLEASMLAGLHKSHTQCHEFVSTRIYLFISILHETLILTFLAMISGIALFSSAAAWPTPIIHHVNVNNDNTTAGPSLRPPK